MITEQDQQRIWKWCGFNRYPQGKVVGGKGSKLDAWFYPNRHWGRIPTLDLNNLFKYAVPKLYSLPDFRLLTYQYIGFAKDIALLRHSWGIHFENDRYYYESGNDPANTLALAILKVIDYEVRK